MRLWPAALLLVACADRSSSGEPTPSRVTPARGAASMAVAVTISGEHFEPLVFADFRSGQGQLTAAFSASLDDGDGGVVALDEVTWLAEHTLTARVPPSAPLGQYDLTVVDPLGRSGMLRSAFQLVSSAENVAAFSFDELAVQTAGVPFVVRVTAVDLEGATVGGFEGEAGLTAPGVTPVALGPFVRGVARGFVTVPAPVTQLTLTVEDAAGRRGQSLPFDVLPGAAARLDFVEGPLQLDAATCAGPFVLERRDALGLPAPDGTAELVTLDVLPADGFGFFTDASCASPASVLPLAAGETRQQFFVEATRAGASVLRVRGAALPSSTRAVEVRPLVASALVLRGSASVRAGACSGEFTLSAEDRLGNAASLASAVPVELDAPGATLHGDATCGQPLGAVTLGAGAAPVRFHLLAAQTGTQALTASALDGGLTASSAVLEVQP